MNILRWAQLPGSTISSFNLYRSILGFHAPVAGLNGLTLTLALNGGSNQTFTFGTGSPVDTLNASLSGGRATLSNDGTQFYVRSTAGSVAIIGGTALTALGQTARVITSQSEYFLLANVLAATDPNTVLEYDDPNGMTPDYYAISSVDTLSTESLLSVFVQPSAFVGALCVIKGLIIDLQGVRQVDAQVCATIEVPPTNNLEANLVKTPVTALSGPDGRFSLALLQGALVRLDIPSIGYSRVVTIPTQAYAYISDLVINTDYQWDNTLSL